MVAEQSTPFGSLDAPADGDSYQGDTLQIRGWGLDNRSISNIYAVIDESQQIPLSLGNARPDVDSLVDIQMVPPVDSKQQ